MAVYQYRCTDHGTAEVRRPVGAAPGTVPCPACGTAAARVYTAPGLVLGSPVRRALIDRAERSREQPDVVAAVPPARGPVRRADVLRNPALSRLPRP
jgi:putative FmdB family regulatory protein